MSPPRQPNGIYRLWKSRLSRAHSENSSKRENSMGLHRYISRMKSINRYQRYNHFCHFPLGQGQNEWVSFRQRGFRVASNFQSPSKGLPLEWSVDEGRRITADTGGSKDKNKGRAKHTVNQWSRDKFQVELRQRQLHSPSPTSLFISISFNLLPGHFLSRLV